MPKLAAPKLDQRRQRVLRGARRCFARYGYAGATVKRLEQEIGLSHGAIFNYYPTKLDLLLALVREDLERLPRDWSANGWEDLARATVNEDRGWLGVYVEVLHLLRTDPAIRQRWEASAGERTAVDALRRDQQAGRLRSDVPAEQIYDLLGLVLDGLVIRSALASQRFDVEPVLKLVRDAIGARGRDAQS